MGAAIFLRFWAAAAALWLTSAVVGGMTIRPLSALILAVVLAGVGAAVSAVWPLHGPGSPSLSGWLASAVVLWGAQFVVPFYQVSPFGALVGGGLIWLLDQLFPVVFS